MKLLCQCGNVAVWFSMSSNRVACCGCVPKSDENDTGIEYPISGWFYDGRGLHV